MSLRLLIVDDNTEFLHVARELFEREGMTVVAVARTGVEALERVDELRPDVVLVDINLGEESGLDLAKRLPNLAGAESLHVVLISSHAEEDLRELIEASPAVGFLSKSELSGRALLEMVRRPGAQGGAGAG